jgi:hypothetical protein
MLLNYAGHAVGDARVQTIQLGPWDESGERFLGHYCGVRGRVYRLYEHGSLSRYCLRWSYRSSQIYDTIWVPSVDALEHYLNGTGRSHVFSEGLARWVGAAIERAAKCS